MIDLSDKRVLITGGGRGIGRSTALAFAKAGAAVVVGARSKTELDMVVNTIVEAGGTSYAFEVDVSNPAHIQQFTASATQAMGGIDILINNAGIAKSHKFATHPDALWNQIISVNLTGVYLMTKAVVPLMLAQGWGRIINIGSIASKVGGKYIAAYTASKHGVLGLTRALAAELAPDISVNVIAPGYVNTPMTEETVANIVARTGMSKAEAISTLVKESPQKRLIEPEEISALALYLASDAAQGITGQAINVDGGTVMY